MQKAVAEEVEMVQMNDGSAANSPLMQAAAEEDLDEFQYAPVLEEKDLIRPGAFIWALTFSAGISGLLFGYDTGVISSTLVSIGSDLSSRPLTIIDKSLITSCTSLFALIASPITGILADKLGRKKVILVADVLFILGALWQAFTSTVWGMIAGRSVVGLAVGSASLLVPLYISEVSPSPFRGRLVTVSSLLITGGQVVAYVIGYLLSSRARGWRWMVGIGALPAALQSLTLAFLPETPRWLVKADRQEEAKRVLINTYGGGQGVHHMVGTVLREIEREILEEEGAIKKRRSHTSTSSKPSSIPQWFMRLQDTWAELFGVGGNRRALTIACMLQGFQQLCGFNSLMYYSATIFALVGFDSPTLPALSIALTNFLFTLLAFKLIDRIGRRRILLLSIPFMVAGLLLCALAFLFVDTSPPSSSNLSNNITTVSPSLSISTKSLVDATPTTSWSILLLPSLLLYVSAYALGLGNVPWQQSELFPFSVRSLGSGLASATNWGSNFVVGLTFLPLMARVGASVTLLVYAVVCCLGWCVVRGIYPETMGLGLEEVGALLRDGWGVEESLRRVERRKRGCGGGGDVEEEEG
ncbi:MAG: hypothetical protein M1836_001506 [Candelina mexicana]|nr:MAG: hypothetical protein M1836_001506 [Candelina mexicana]